MITAKCLNSIIFWRETNDINRKSWRSGKLTVNVCHAIFGVPRDQTNRVVESLVQCQRKHVTATVREKTHIIEGEQFLIALNLLFE
jgi:hypothetical protein